MDLIPGDKSKLIVANNNDKVPMVLIKYLTL